MLNEMLGRDKNVEVGHSAVAGCFESGDTKFIQLIDFFPILSGCFVISLNLTFKKGKKKKTHLKHIFNIFYLAGFPDISSIFYLLALEVKPGYCTVLVHSVPFFLCIFLPAF